MDASPKKLSMLHRVLVKIANELAFSARSSSISATSLLLVHSLSLPTAVEDAQKQFTKFKDYG
jgi:hypothetical protein